MKIAFPLLVLVLLVCVARPGSLSAQTKATKELNSYAFTTYVYRMPSSDLQFGFVSQNKGQLHAPPLPPASTSAGELEAFIKRNNAVVQEYFQQEGLPLQKGSLAIYDPESQTLVLRAMNAVHELMTPFAKVLRDTAPKYLTWSVAIVEAPAPAVRVAMTEALAAADHASVFDRLLAQGKVAVSMRGETKSGQRAGARAGSRLDVPTDYELDNKHVQANFDEQGVGTEFELDPVLGPDGMTIDVNLALFHRFAPLRARWEKLTSAEPEKIEARVFDAPEAKVQTSVSMLDNTMCLLGVWSLDGAAEPERATAMQAAFLRVNVAPLMPLASPRAEQLLAAHGEAVEPTPKNVRPVADPSLPPGMIVRRFRVPPDFISSAGEGGAAAAPADPFAPVGAPPKEPRFTRRVTVEDILKSAGVPFPEGASANYIHSTSELIVRNTPANAELVATILESLRGKSPKLIAFSAHIVQADAAFLRKLSSETLALPDHVAAWQEIEAAVAAGKAKIVRSLWLETKSGQRASSESVIDYVKGTGLVFAEASNEAITDESKKTDNNKAGTTTTVNVRSNQSADRLTMHTEHHPFGLRMEFDPVIGPDGYTIDLNFALDYDFAPPLQTSIDEPLPERTRRLAMPQTEFHTTHVQTATTFLSGSTRLLSLWKPDGAPDAAGDVLQAAFLRCDIMMIAPADK